MSWSRHYWSLEQRAPLVRSSSEIPLYFLTPCTHCAFWLFDCLARHTGGIPQIWSERPWLMFYLPGITTTLTPFRPWGSPTVSERLWIKHCETELLRLLLSLCNLKGLTLSNVYQYDMENNRTLFTCTQVESGCWLPYYFIVLMFQNHCTVLVTHHAYCRVKLTAAIPPLS